MEEVKSIIDNLGNDVLEASVKIANVADIPDSGEMVYQINNVDLTNQTQSMDLGAFFLSLINYIQTPKEN